MRIKSNLTKTCKINFWGGVWAIRLPAPKKFSTNSTSSNLKHSHYDHGLWLYGLLKSFCLTHATRTCFKETALLFNVHLSCFVNLILSPS